METNKVNILDVCVDKITLSQALSEIENAIVNPRQKPFVVFTPNSEIIMNAQSDSSLMDALHNADMLIPDGIGVVKAAKILGDEIPQRVAGYDLTMALLKEGNEKPYSFFIFGGKPGVAQTAKDNLHKSYPDINIAGLRNGYFSEDENDDIINEINLSGSDVLLVALGAPKQEKWITDNIDKLKVKVCIGIGGSVDVIAGVTNRAPDIFIKLNLEWLYRIAKQPSRWGRALALPKFALTVLFKGKRVKK